MKKILLAFVIMLTSLSVQAQYQGLWFEASDSYKLGDSTVTIWGSDTLTSPVMVRAIIAEEIPEKVDSSEYSDTAGYALNAIEGKVDSSAYSDTAGYALNATGGADSLFYAETNTWLANGDTITKIDSSWVTANAVAFNTDTSNIGLFSIYNDSDSSLIISTDKDGGYSGYYFSMYDQVNFKNIGFHVDGASIDAVNDGVETYVEITGDSVKAESSIGLFEGVVATDYIGETLVVEKTTTDTVIVAGDTVTAIGNAQTIIESIEFDELTTVDMSITGVLERYIYEAFAYVDPDSTITTSLTTSWVFMGSGESNKFTNLYANGFTTDGDTLMFDQNTSDLRDSVEFRINYGGNNATNSVNKQVFNGIFIKSEGESVYSEYRPVTKSAPTRTANIYYSGPTCTLSPIWLKDGDKIQIRAKCAATTTTLSTSNFSIYLHEE